MRALIKIIKEQYHSFYLIMRLAKFQLRIDNQNNYLGFAWEILNPAIQMAMYWFVFGFGVRGKENITNGHSEIPYIYWMLAGISMWFFINKAILNGSKAIYQKYTMVAKMNFPLSVLPSYIIMGKYYGHLALVGLIMVVFWIKGYYPSIYYIQLIYFLLMSYILAFAITLVTSTLTVVVRDIQMLIQSLLQAMFFLSPILWDRSTSMPHWIQSILQLNPFYYLANGYRASLLYNDWYIVEHWQLTLYNWGLILFLLLIGSTAHFKFRNRFSDFI
ncbi:MULTISPECIES: ABC transporter permease [Rummeliibacillus]|uniref:ABC transporter permease n=1 Tax=Rummeliibacillus TaxID=648802 RepID=UPI0011697D72|nr:MULTISPECIES: ABC transporter permease [Rummeliibacillus]MBB5170453.1 teichoic acid transport system permease protein [Rummeliibacillus stabekisii]MCM3315266.1 ABC transporter permease [Rummeliibacillus stabekisii]GEL04708.1 transport permease protein [Rummeliibacillus stabekisii]